MKKLLKTLPALLAAMGFASVLSSCDEGDRRDAERKVERGVEKTGDKIEDAGDRIEDETDPD
jgi:hypothetical protein